MPNEIIAETQLEKDIQKLKLEYVTTETSLEKIALNSGFNLRMLESVAIEEQWELQKKAYNTQIMNEFENKIQEAKVKATMNTILRASKLQKMTFDAIEEDIKNGKYKPTISEFTRLSETIESIGKKDVKNIGIIGDNNKVLNITLQKPLEEMSLEELNDVQRRIKNGNE